MKVKGASESIMDILECFNTSTARSIVLRGSRQQQQQNRGGIKRGNASNREKSINGVAQDAKWWRIPVPVEASENYHTVMI